MGKPGKRHKTGFRGPSPDVGKATQFKPGESGNPSGRPKSIEPLLRKVIDRVDDTDPQKRTFGQKFVDSILDRAMRRSDPLAIELMNRLDGKVAQTDEHTGPNGGPIAVEHIVRFVKPDAKSRP